MIRLSRPAALAAMVLAMIAIGTDIHLLGRVAPIVARALGAPPSALTGAFVLHQFGLAVGAFTAGLIADRWGRRRVLFASMLVAALLTFATPLSRSITELSLIRAMAGVALGMASPIVLAMVSNLASDQWRGLAVGATLAGNPIGSAVGSAIAMRIAGIDYAPGFAFTGCVVLAALVPIALSEPSPVPSTAQRRKPVQTLLTPLYRDITVRLGLCFFLSLALTSTLSSWQPTYFESLADIPVQKFATVAIYGAPASVLGMLSAGFFSIRAPRPIVVTVIFGGHALALASTGWLSFGTAGFAAAYFASSVMQSAGQGLLNVIIAERYPDTIRATAFAAAAAAGRAGGIIGPWFGVAPIAAHVQLALVFSFLSCVPLIVGMLILSHKQTARTEPSG